MKNPCPDDQSTHVRYRSSATPEWSLLEKACSSGDDAIALRLLQQDYLLIRRRHGGTTLVNTQMKNGENALFVAAGKGHESAMEVLIRCGADVNLTISKPSKPEWTRSCTLQSRDMETWSSA